MYILQTLIFQLFFLVSYDLFHKKDTFFTGNRIYLLATSILSLLLPLIQIQSIQKTIPDNYVTDLPTIFIDGSTTPNEVIATMPIDSSILTNVDFWLLIYLTGIVITTYLFIRKIRIILLLKKNSVPETIHQHSVRLVLDSKDAYTFWNTIYLGDQLTSKERDQILTHELVHKKEKHTLDLLWFEICKIIFWFNPLIHIYQIRIIALHEYISDAYAIKLLGKQAYYEQLLNANFKTTNVQFVNNFFSQKLLQKRIKMLQKRKSKSIVKFKYLAIIPLVIAMITLTSFSEKVISINSIKSKTEASQEGKNIISEPVIINKEIKKNKSVLENTRKQVDSTKKGVPFTEIDKVPTTTSCKDLTDQSEIKNCVSNEIKNFVNKNFNTNLGEELGLIGVNRIYVKFKIDKTGKIVDIQSRAPHPKLGEEAKRVISLIPQMIPGEQDGKKVDVLYSLPIVFKINSETNLEKKVTTQPSYKDMPPLVENLSYVNDHNVKNGYYLITNIFKTDEYLKKGIANLKEQGLKPKWFKNPKDSYLYMYLEKYDTLEDAKKMLLSDFDGKYTKELYILNIQ